MSGVGVEGGSARGVRGACSLCHLIVSVFVPTMERERERVGGERRERGSCARAAPLFLFFFFSHLLAVISAFISRLVISLLLGDEPRLSASAPLLVHIAASPAVGGVQDEGGEL